MNTTHKINKICDIRKGIIRMPYKEKENGKWQVRVELGKDPITGKRRRRYATVDTEEEAKIKEVEMLEDMRMGIRADSGEVTVAQHLKKYLRKQKNSLKPRTFHSYKMIIEKHLIPALGQLKLRELTPEHIDTYQEYKLEKGNLKDNSGLSNRTVQYHHRVLSRALKFAVRWRYIKRNPCEYVDAPSVKSTKSNVRPLKPHEISPLFEEMKGNIIYNISTVALFTGMRLGEIIGLKHKYIDMQDRTIGVEKSLQYIQETDEFVFQDTKSESREISMNETLYFIFKKRKNEIEQMKDNYKHKYNDSGYIFCYPDGSPFKYYNISQRFAHRRKKLDLPEEIHFHCLRHTFATMFLEEGGEMKTLQYLLGHSTYKMTADLYSHVTEKMKKSAQKKITRAVNRVIGK